MLSSWDLSSVRSGPQIVLRRSKCCIITSRAPTDDANLALNNQDAIIGGVCLQDWSIVYGFFKITNFLIKFDF